MVLNNFLYTYIKIYYLSLNNLNTLNKTHCTSNLQYLTDICFSLEIHTLIIKERRKSNKWQIPTCRVQLLNKYLKNGVTSS